LDLFTRCIIGLRVTPVSTKAVDVAGVLYETVVTQPAPPDWPDQACWPYHGIPQHLVFTEDRRHLTMSLLVGRAPPWRPTKAGVPTDRD